MTRILAPVLVVLLLAGCAHRAPPAAPSAAAAPPVPASPASAPRLFAPPAALSPRSASQVIHAAYGSRVATLRTAVQIDSAGLTVVGVTATGMRLFSAFYDGQRVSAERSPFVPKEVSPERVLADMQLALWPLASLQSVYAGSGQTISEPVTGVRRVVNGDRLIAEVHYASDDPWTGRLWFVNFEFGYSLTIDTTTAN
jgi:hypothetical protein